ncbi:hypothetical protein JCGZ_19686 [Jatropha curcas]|uniref:Uncharacterized protein n=1 Tax=Jatropha curcas TaxID=180498 RepID=A0A067LJ31_JATCU|nr:hypothetical protein JCGZ_19686 [Jatropha curcas]
MGHYARNCPKKPKQTIALLHQLKVSCPDYDSEHDLESLFSEEESASPEPPDLLCPESQDFISCPLSPLPPSHDVFADLSFAEIPYCFPHISSPCKIPTPVSSPSLSDCSAIIFPSFSTPELEEDPPSSPEVSSVQLSHPVPLISMHVLPDKYEKPVAVTALFDTSSHCTMINPDVLPAHFWKKKILHFTTADGKRFQTTMVIKKRIGLQFFPDCIIWTHVIGSYLFGRDLLIGFDVYHWAQNLQILPSGIKYKRQFKPYTNSLNQFSIAAVPLEYQGS